MLKNNMIKSITILIAFICINAISVLAQDNNLPEKTLKFNEIEYDFGQIEEGDIATHVFEFKNISKEKITISSVKASCGCTTPDWTKEPIKKKGNGSITASYNSAGRPGIFQKSLTVFTSKGQIVLTIKGHVIDKKTQ